MKVLHNNLSIMEASTLVKAIEDAFMYRSAWVNDTIHPCEVALGYDENGTLYVVANDEEYGVAYEDLIASDWMVAVLGEKIDSEVEHFDKCMLKILEVVGDMSDANYQMPSIRSLFEALTEILEAWFGEDDFGHYMETGELSPIGEEKVFNLLKQLEKMKKDLGFY